jgi:hypothetical protein
LAHSTTACIPRRSCARAVNERSSRANGR